MESSLRLYRVSRSKYIRDLSGMGAKMYGGRWNRPGVAVLYASQHRSLALLELIVHFQSRQAFHNRYQFVELSVNSKDVTDIVKQIKTIDLQQPNNNELWTIVDHYFFNEDVLCLKVPSVLVPHEFNYLLHPDHERFEEVKVLGFHDAFVDNRYSQLI